MKASIGCVTRARRHRHPRPFGGRRPVPLPLRPLRHPAAEQLDLLRRQRPPNIRRRHPLVHSSEVRPIQFALQRLARHDRGLSRKSRVAPSRVSSRSVGLAAGWRPGRGIETTVGQDRADVATKVTGAAATACAANKPIVRMNSNRRDMRWLDRDTAGKDGGCADQSQRKPENVAIPEAHIGVSRITDSQGAPPDLAFPISRERLDVPGVSAAVFVRGRHE